MGSQHFRPLFSPLRENGLIACMKTIVKHTDALQLTWIGRNLHWEIDTHCLLHLEPFQLSGDKTSSNHVLKLLAGILGGKNVGSPTLRNRLQPRPKREIWAPIGVFLDEDGNYLPGQEAIAERCAQAGITPNVYIGFNADEDGIELWAQKSPNTATRAASGRRY